MVGQLPCCSPDTDWLVVFADWSSQGTGTVYRLNLTSLQDTEVILSAAFHFLLQRRPHHKSWSCKRFKSPSCRPLSVHPSPSISLILRSISFGSEVSPGPMGLLLGNMTFHPQRRGAWQMKDVTQVIKEARNKGHLLMSVELDVGQRKPEEVQPSNSLPYLLLYAEDRALAEPNSVAASLQRYDPLGEAGEPELLHHAGSSTDTKGRMRREVSLPSERIENNELPEVDYRPEGHRKEDLWESTWYLALKPKHKAEKKDSKRKSQEEGVTKQSRATHDREHVMGKEAASQPLNPHESEVTKVKGVVGTLAATDGLKHERRSDGKDSRKAKGILNAGSPVLSFDEQTMRQARRRQWGGGQQRGCSRRNLRVDFADIGWSEWVIAPKAFDAYYCAGTCGFPIPKVRAETPPPPSFPHPPQLCNTSSVCKVPHLFLLLSLSGGEALQPCHHPEHSPSRRNRLWRSWTLLRPRKDESPGCAFPGRLQEPSAQGLPQYVRPVLLLSVREGPKQQERETKQRWKKKKIKQETGLKETELYLEVVCEVVS